jgi:hypothetical protein
VEWVGSTDGSEEDSWRGFGWARGCDDVIGAIIDVVVDLAAADGTIAATTAAAGEIGDIGGGHGAVYMGRFSVNRIGGRGGGGIRMVKEG